MKYCRRGLAALIVMTAMGASCVSTGQAPALTEARLVETGVHWPAPADYQVLKNFGYQFAIISLDSRQDHWVQAFDEAERVGIRLIPGLYPYPFRWDGTQWIISARGRQFIEYAASRPHLVKALFTLNEPYWVDPATGKNTYCGAVDAAQLRMLRQQIREIWPEAKVYHDLGQPSAWAPGGWLHKDHACIGDRYADATGVADFVGIWFYPVDAAKGYQRARAIVTMREEIDYVSIKMGALPVVLAQAFRCRDCGEATRYPKPIEIKDLNCTFRDLGPHAVSWYVWRQDLYDEVLANHPEMWPLTSPSACFEEPQQ